jgi:hypothetical protein
MAVASTAAYIVVVVVFAPALPPATALLPLPLRIRCRSARCSVAAALPP